MGYDDICIFCHILSDLLIVDGIHLECQRGSGLRVLVKAFIKTSGRYEVI